MNSPNFLQRRVAWLAIVFIALARFLPFAGAAEAGQMSFDVPAGAANQTLKQFASQSGREIVFAPDSVNGVQTHAVQGNFTARQALDSMLTDTGLVASEDATTGALAVRPSVPAKPAKNTDNPPAARPRSTDIANETVKLATYVVTGSNLPTAADATDVPVTVVESQDIAATGVNANMLDMLRKRIPAFAGRSSVGASNATNANQNTAGGSQIQLRNLDTLVLINGRRVAVSGANADNGGKNFVDVAQIPTAAIARIEVLTDGASAIYGSDAVGGVINVILKSDYEGAEAGVRYAMSPNDGHYSERSGYVVAGAGKNGTNITVTGSWSKTDPLWQNQRPFVSSNFQVKTTFPGVAGGNFLAPGLNSPSSKNPTGTAATANSYADLLANGTYVNPVPSVNLAPYQTILLRTDQKAATASLTTDLIPKKITAFADYVTSVSKSFAQTNAFLNNLSSVTVPAGSPYNPLTVAATGVVAGNLDTPLQTFNRAEGDRVTGGLKGEINSDWNWEIGGTYSQEKLTQSLKNELFVPNLAAAIAGGYNSAGVATPGGNYSKVNLITGYPYILTPVFQPALDPFARSGLNPASLANVYGTEVIKTLSTLDGVDAKIVGTPFDLPAGKFALAVGAASRQESLSGTPDADSYNLSTAALSHNWGAGGVFFDPFSKKRTIDSYYAETRIPLAGPGWNAPGLHALDVSVAGRSEKYSDTGKSSVPKIGARWQPVDDQVTFRFTYSKAFTAPDLWHEYGPPSVTAASSATFFSGNLGVSDPRLNQTFNYFSGNGNNPGLQPSQAWSRSFGVVLTPKFIKGLTLSFDYVNVYQKGLAAGIGASNIIASVNALGAASPYFSGIAVGGIAGTPGASQALLAAPQGLFNYLVSGNYQSDIYITDHFINSGGVHVEALDFSAEYAIPTERLGQFTLGTTGTNLQHFLYATVPGAPFYEFAGYSTNTQTEAGSFAKFSFYTTLDWKYQQWNATVGDSYISSMTDIGSAAPLTYAPANYLLTHPAVKVNYYTTLDLQLGYTFDPATEGAMSRWFKGTKLSVGVNNVFNRMPPYAGLSQAAGNNNNNVDTAAYSPIGRLLFISASVKF
jgi:iron complex outermembrane receptor protein